MAAAQGFEVEEGGLDAEVGGERVRAGGTAIDAERQIYPYCIVWTPIPVLTWLFPFVGHMGIGDSTGLISDFAGPYYIGQGELAFGSPTRYIQFAPKRGWDPAIREANGVYCKRMHNICFVNCHSHVATALDSVELYGFRYWNMIILAAWMFFFGRFVSVRAFLWTLAPSAFLYGFLFFALARS